MKPYIWATLLFIVLVWCLISNNLLWIKAELNSMNKKLEQLNTLDEIEKLSNRIYNKTLEINKKVCQKENYQSSND